MKMMKKNEIPEFMHPSEAIENLADLFDIYSRNIAREHDLSEHERSKEIAKKGYLMLKLAALISSNSKV